MTLGTKIQQLRKTAELSQEQLADNLGVSRQAISKWETDQALPEIDKLLALSKLFSVSTDNLLGNDVVDIPEYDNAQTSIYSKVYSDIVSSLTRIVRSKDMKVYLYIFSIMCFIAIGVCMIVDYAINDSITWGMYPILSVTFGWLISLPIFYKKYMLSLGFVTVLVGPFLFLLDKVTPVISWFLPVGVPASIVGIVILWITYILYRYIKINLFYKLSISPCLTGIASNFVISHYVDIFLNTKTSLFDTIVNVFSFALAAIILCSIGYTRSKKEKAD